MPPDVPQVRVTWDMDRAAAGADSLRRDVDAVTKTRCVARVLKVVAGA
jgi:hypothetical protein